SRATATCLRWFPARPVQTSSWQARPVTASPVRTQARKATSLELEVDEFIRASGHEEDQQQIGRVQRGARERSERARILERVALDAVDVDVGEDQAEQPVLRLEQPQIREVQIAREIAQATDDLERAGERLGAEEDPGEAHEAEGTHLPGPRLHGRGPGGLAQVVLERQEAPVDPAPDDEVHAG